MKKIFITTIFILLAITNVNAKELDTESLNMFQKISLANVLGKSNQELYSYIDNDFIELNLTNAFSDKKLQKQVYQYCQKKNIPYSFAIVTAYKESTMNEDSIHYNPDGSLDVGIMQIHIKADEYEHNKYLLKALPNMQEGIYRMWQIKERYDAYTLYDINIAYQYGYKTLYAYREGEPLPKQERFFNRMKVSEEYILKMIRRKQIDEVIIGKRLEINISDQNIHLPKIINY
ncbi:MAG: transglycosylase SLT domain-containing protein [Bacilli bacterium]|nr:transglycosylase SLT domain-containing protein [Bacilli bacterium]